MIFCFVNILEEAGVILELIAHECPDFFHPVDDDRFSGMLSVKALILLLISVVKRIMEAAQPPGHIFAAAFRSSFCRRAVSCRTASGRGIAGAPRISTAWHIAGALRISTCSARSVAGSRYVRRAARGRADLLRKRRVRKQAPAEHKAAAGRGGACKECFGALFVPHRENIPVVDERNRGFIKQTPENRKVRHAGVHFLPRSRMDNQLRKRILTVDRKDSFKFFGGVHAEACFDGNAERLPASGPDLLRTVIDFIKERVQLVRHTKKTGTFMFVHHCRHGAAEVEIDFRVAEVRHVARRGEKFFGIVGENLGDKRGAGVVVRENVHLLAGLDLACESRDDKRRKIPVYAAKTRVMRIPVNIAGDPLQRGKI